MKERRNLRRKMAKKPECTEQNGKCIEMKARYIKEKPTIIWLEQGNWYMMKT